MESSKLPYEEFLRIFSKVPRLCVDLLIKTEKGILFTKRSINPYKGKWHLPGGSVLFNETLEQAVKRIGKNELGLNVEPIKILGAIDFFNEGKEKRHSVSIVFLTKIKSGQIILNSEANDFKFYKKIPKSIITQQGEFLEKINE